MKRALPDKLRVRHEDTKRITLSKVQNAIDILQEDNEIVSKKKLIELTKLSNSTFSKQHVKELLKTNQVCQYKTLRKSNEVSEIKQLELLLKENEKQKNRINLLDSKLQDKDIKYERLLKKYENSDNSNKLLRHKLHSIMEVVDKVDLPLKIRRMLNFDNL